MRYALLLSLLLAACASAPPAPAPAPEPDPATQMLPETPKFRVEAAEEGNNLVLISKRGEQEMDRLTVRGVRGGGIRLDTDANCLFDSPANEVDFQIAALLVNYQARGEAREPELYAVYGASKGDGKFKKFPKRAASCYFLEE